MNMEIRVHVLQLLEDYPERERKIALLRYEMEHPTQISLDEMIDSMTFSSGDRINIAKTTSPIKRYILHLTISKELTILTGRSQMRLPPIWLSWNRRRTD